ncbi:Sld5 [Carabus blaptoides fortunei]
MDSDLELSFESDNEELTAGDILKSMEEIWLNEKFAPDILQNKMEIVECLYLQIQEMEKNVDRLEKNDVRRCAHELELIRIRFLLSSYLRVRLLKIETFSQTILAEEESNKMVDGVVVDDGGNNDNVVDIKTGSKLIMSYSSIATLLHNGDVRLI